MAKSNSNGKVELYSKSCFQMTKLSRVSMVKLNFSGKVELFSQRCFQMAKLR